jgi:hypothetical protein
MKYRTPLKNGKCMLLFSNNLSKTKTDPINKVKMSIANNTIT